MAQSAPAYPYETRLNILHPPMEVIDEKAISDACEYKWFNQTLCKVNDSVVRVGIIEGEYHWHKHDNDDEFFYVVEGQLLIDLEGTYGRTLASPGLRCSPRRRPSHPGTAAHRHPDGRERRHHPDGQLADPRYFSLLGGTRPFSLMYNASVAYCSLSWDTLAHAKPMRVRVTGPRVSICRIFSSVSEA